MSSEISCQRCRTSSDLGNTECVLLTPHYSQYQWATCLTDAYIRQKSNQSHLCRNSAVQCWYQCQLEINDQESGAVYSNCRCSTDRPTAPNPCPDLNQNCHSPDGTSCNWYRNCLEQCYPCEGTGDGYAIEFAEKFATFTRTILIHSVSVDSDGSMEFEDVCKLHLCLHCAHLLRKVVPIFVAMHSGVTHHAISIQDQGHHLSAACQLEAWGIFSGLCLVTPTSCLLLLLTLELKWLR